MPGETRHERAVEVYGDMFREHLDDDDKLEEFTADHLRREDKRAWAFYRGTDVTQRRAWAIVDPVVPLSQSTRSRVLRKMDRRILTREFDLGPALAEEAAELAGEPPLNYERPDLEAIRDTIAEFELDMMALYALASGDENAHFPPELEGRVPDVERRHDPETVNTTPR
jgi:hypothetical protein